MKPWLCQRGPSLSCLSTNPSLSGTCLSNLMDEQACVNSTHPGFGGSGCPLLLRHLALARVYLVGSENPRAPPGPPGLTSPGYIHQQPLFLVLEVTGAIGRNGESHTKSCFPRLPAPAGSAGSTGPVSAEGEERLPLALCSHLGACGQRCLPPARASPGHPSTGPTHSTAAGAHVPPPLLNDTLPLSRLCGSRPFPDTVNRCFDSWGVCVAVP